jgi:hypothetical protein
MRTLKLWVGLLLLPLLAIAGCHELTHDGPGDYGSVGSSIVGEIQYINTNTREIELRQDSGRSWTIRFDQNTKVVYQQRSYAVTNLEPGDYVALNTQQDRDGRLFTDYITVRENARDRGLATVGSEVFGQIISHSNVTNQIDIQRDRGGRISLGYDAQTRFLHQGNIFSVFNLRQGDLVSVTVRSQRDSQGRPMANVLTLRQTAQESASGSKVSTRFDRFEGIVSNIDARRGTFELRDARNRLVIVSIPHNAPRAISDRFNRLRAGENLRVEGRFIDQDRFDLENFL